ncbi:MAG: glutathione S-transferase N-terminal domain-containing protein [Myxococcota bacterium]
MIEFHCCNSPNNEKVFILLEELELDYVVRYRSIWKLEQYAPDFIALNPNSKMPVIVDRGTASGEPVVVFESGVILQYLAEKHGRLLPRETAARFEVLEWVMFQMANVGPIVGNLFHFNRFAPPGNDYALDRFRNETRRLYGVIESRLAHSAHLGGESFSIADVALHPWVRLHAYSFVDLDAHPATAAWFERCAARPAVARAYAKTEAFRAGFEETLRITPPENLDRVFGRSRP